MGASGFGVTPVDGIVMNVLVVEIMLEQAPTLLVFNHGH
jgi:hypothetical protein